MQESCVYDARTVFNTQHGQTAASERQFWPEINFKMPLSARTAAMAELHLGFGMTQRYADLHVIELAQLFYAGLRERLSPDQIQLCMERQKALPASISSLHEVCDPNQVMLDALAKLFPNRVDRMGEFEYDPEDEQVGALMDVAHPIGRMMLFQLSAFDHAEREQGDVDTTFVGEIAARDPDTRAMITMEVHKDKESGALFAIDASFLDQVSSVIRNPFNPGNLVLQDPSEVVQRHVSEVAPSSTRGKGHPSSQFDNANVVEALLAAAAGLGLAEGTNSETDLLDALFVAGWSATTNDQRITALQSGEILLAARSVRDDPIQAQASAYREGRLEDGALLASLAALPAQRGKASGAAAEVDCWRDMLRVTWAVLSAGQRAAVLSSQMVVNAMQASAVGLRSSAKGLDEEHWDRICEHFGLDSSFEYSSEAIVEYANMYALDPLFPSGDPAAPAQRPRAG